MNQEPTRRSVLAGFAGGAALASAPAGRARMRFGFTSYQWGADWDLASLIANCAKAHAYGVELRTTMKHAHGVELALSASERGEVKRRFATSPVKLIGLACGERFDSPDPAKLQASLAAAQSYVKLAADVGAPGLRVFPNDWQKNVPRERTIEQIGKSLGALGRFARDYGVQIRLENHGTAGRFETLRSILEIAAEPNVRVKLNCDARDAEGGNFAAKFALVQPYLGHTLHMHELDGPDQKFPYQLQFDLLVRAKWAGWCLVEATRKVPDRVAALIALRKSWENMIAEAEKGV